MSKFSFPVSLLLLALSACSGDKDGDDTGGGTGDTGAATMRVDGRVDLTPVQRDLKPQQPVVDPR